MGLQKHERAIIELDLKRQRLDHKVMKEKHQREREHEIHEYRMLQMQMRMELLKKQSALSPAAAAAMMPPPDPVSSLGGSLDAFGLMDDAAVPGPSSSV
jgi:hypothetical protein